MTRDAWRKRQEQWQRFHEWEARQPIVSALSPSERLAEICALVDIAHHRWPSKTIEEERAKLQGILLMRERLAVLGRPG